MKLAFAVFFSALLIGCSQPPWPNPPAADPTQYQAEYDAWRQDRQNAITHAVQLIGLWPLPEGDTPFGADAALPIVLKGQGVPAKAGIFRRTGTKVMVAPVPGSPLALENGGTITAPLELKSVMDPSPTVLAVGSLRLQIEQVFEKFGARRWVTAWDEDHPIVKSPPVVEAYPPDQRWRVAARFDAFATPRSIRVSDVLGGFMDLTAAGELVFHLNGQEQRLTAITFDGSDDFFVMFKDDTNRSTTYAGYRTLFARGVEHKGWTVLDFNLAANPPCAYSTFTTCPLPPPENQLAVAIEAGEKRYPSAQGFAPAGP